MKTPTIALTFTIALLFSNVVSIPIFKLASANPLPPIDPTIMIDSPQNATFSVDSLILNFTGRSNWNVYSYYYSLDAQGLKPVENTAIVLQEEANIGKSPNVNRTTIRGNCILYNLTEGWHNLTIYNIANQDFIWNFPQYRKGDTMCQMEYSFKIQSESPITLPIATTIVTSTTLITLASLAIVLLKKHKINQGG